MEVLCFFRGGGVFWRGGEAFSSFLLNCLFVCISFSFAEGRLVEYNIEPQKGFSVNIQTYEYIQTYRKKITALFEKKIKTY